MDWFTFTIFRNMRVFVLVVLCLNWTSRTYSSENQKVWSKTESGTILYLSPVKDEWIPASAKEKVPVKTYVITKDSTIATIFRDAEAYELPPNSYFFIEDIFDRTRLEIISTLIRIDAEQLPSQLAPEESKKIGLVYGAPREHLTSGEIPYENERKNAFQWFINHKKYGPALLSLKRMMSRYPQAYLNQNYLEQLFYLYDWFNLYGFLLEETKLLLNDEASRPNKVTIEKWFEYVQKKIMIDEQK